MAVNYYPYSDRKSIPLTKGVYFFMVIMEDGEEIFTYVGRSHNLYQRINCGSHLYLQKTVSEFGESFSIGIVETDDIYIEKNCMRLLRPLYNFWPRNPILASRFIHEVSRKKLEGLFGVEMVDRLINRKTPKCLGQ